MVFRKAPLLTCAFIAVGFAGGYYFKGTLTEAQVTNAQSESAVYRAESELHQKRLDTYRNEFEERLRRLEEKLPPDKFGELKDALGVVPGLVEFTAAASDKWPLAAQINEAFEDGGWTVKFSQRIDMSGVAWQVPSDKFGAVAEALAKANIDFQMVVPASSNADITIYIPADSTPITPPITSTPTPN